MENTDMTISGTNLKASLRMLDKMGERNLEQLRESAPEQTERLEKLGNLLSNEDFAKQFAACADKEAAAKLFADHGFEITMEELEALMAQIKAIFQKLVENDGELSEEDLEMIAGGISESSIDSFLVGFFGVIGAAVGTIICPGLGGYLGAVIGCAIGGYMAESDF